MAYDWKKGLLKFNINAAIVIAAGLASVYGDSPYYLAIAPLIGTLINWIKHK